MASAVINKSSCPSADSINQNATKNKDEAVSVVTSITATKNKGEVVPIVIPITATKIIAHNSRLTIIKYNK